MQVKTKDGHEVGTPNIVLATSSPLHRNLGIHSRQHPYRTYCVGLQIPEVRALLWASRVSAPLLASCLECLELALFLPCCMVLSGSLSQGGQRPSLQPWAPHA